MPKFYNLQKLFTPLFYMFVLVCLQSAPNSTNNSFTGDHDEEDKKRIMRRLDMNNQLAGLNKMLEMKEQLHKKILSNDAEMLSEMKVQYEVSGLKMTANMPSQ